MPKGYQRVGEVTCNHCGASMTKRRDSQTGRYFCSKPNCQKARRAEWASGQTASLAKTTRTMIQDHTAAFLEAVLHAPRVVCPECGLKNALAGYVHFASDGGPCGRLGRRVEGITQRHALAVWPPESREYEAFS